MAMTRRGSNLSGRPVIAVPSAPITNPACTIDDSSACRAGLIAPSRTMSGRAADVANQGARPKTTAVQRRISAVSLLMMLSRPRR